MFEKHVENRVTVQRSVPRDMPSSSAYPRARSNEHLVAQQVADEFVIYDTNCHQVHNLNPTAATVWQWCDGATPPSTMAKRLAVAHDLGMEQASALLWLTLNRLDRAGLLVNLPAATDAEKQITRRHVLRAIGIAALLPMIYTITAPTAYAQLSVILTCAGGDDCNTQGGATITVYNSANCTGTPATVNNNGNLCSNLCGHAFPGAGGGTIQSFRVTAGNLQNNTDCSLQQCMNCA